MTGWDLPKAACHARRRATRNSEKGTDGMTTRFKFLVMLGLCLSLTLGACGRKGALDNPAAPAPAADSNAAVDPAIPLPPDESLTPRNDSFFLDFLI